MNLNFNTLVFRLHWIAGITAGLVLAVVAATGGLLGLEEPISNGLNPQLDIRPSQAATPRSPDALLVVAQQAWPKLQAGRLSWQGDDRAMIVQMSGARRGDRRQVPINPYTGELLPPIKGKAFFHAVEDMHRHLAAGKTGRQIVGASTALLLLLASSGLIQRWPRRHSLRIWLRPDFRLSGRGLWRNMHSILGTWALLFYLLASLTGLWWSYDFYRNTLNSLAGVSGSHRPHRVALKANRPLVSVDAAWHSFRSSVPTATAASLSMSTNPSKPLSLRYQTEDSPHDRAWNTLSLDAASGMILSRELYAQQPRGRRFISSLFPLHSGSFFGQPGLILMAVASLLMPFFTVTGFVLWVQRRRKARRAGKVHAQLAAASENA